MKNVIGTQPFYLAQPLGATDVTMQVRGLKDARGNLITAMPSGVTELTITIEPRSTTNQEFVSGTGITDNGNGLVTITGLTRNLSPVDGSADLSDTVSHANNSECIISNSPFSMRKVLTTDEDKTVTATIDFATSPTVPTATSAGQAVNKSQLDLAVLGTVPASSTTVLGAVRIATDPSKTLGNVSLTIASPCVAGLSSHGLTANDTIRFTTTGALPTGLVVGTTYYVISTGLTSNTFQISLTAEGVAVNTSGSQSGTHTLYRTTPYAVNDQDTRLPTQGENDALAGNDTSIAAGTGNKFVTQTGLQKNPEKYASDASASSTTYTATLSPAPTSLTDGMVVYVKIGLANTTTTPTLNVNGLGARTIVKGTSTALTAGDILAGQYCTFIYDLTGTRWVLQNPVATNTIVIQLASAGTAVTANSSTEVFLTTAPMSAYHLAKEIVCGKSGTFSISFEMKAQATYTAFGRIYKNGVAIGTERSTTSTIYVTSTVESFSFVTGDLIQLYGKNSADGIGTYYQNFKVMENAWQINA